MSLLTEPGEPPVEASTIMVPKLTTPVLAWPAGMDLDDLPRFLREEDDLQAPPPEPWTDPWARRT